LWGWTKIDSIMSGVRRGREGARRKKWGWGGRLERKSWLRRWFGSGGVVRRAKIPFIRSDEEVVEKGPRGEDRSVKGKRETIGGSFSCVD